MEDDCTVFMVNLSIPYDKNTRIAIEHQGKARYHYKSISVILLWLNVFALSREHKPPLF